MSVYYYRLHRVGQFDNKKNLVASTLHHAAAGRLHIIVSIYATPAVPHLAFHILPIIYSVS